MRITRETLLKLAQTTAAQRVKVSRRLVCIYLTGSVLEEEPLLGGTTDIDLVCIHDSEPLQSREIVRLSDEVSLDISHYAQADFHQPRHLRVHPWLGYFIYNKPLLLHDTSHWFEFTQASTGAQFFQADFVLARAKTLAESARQLWMDLSFNDPGSHPRRVYGFMKALEQSGNALASLTGSPLTERHFAVRFPQRMQSMQRADLSKTWLDLLTGSAAVSDETWKGWLSGWENDLHAVAAQENCPARLHPARRGYYERAAAALWNEHPTAAFWLLMRTWTLAASHLPQESPPPGTWLEACLACGLDEANFHVRLESLDLYLDSVEETLDRFAEKNGVLTTPEI
jgi:hypothetical protein